MLVCNGINSKYNIFVCHLPVLVFPGQACYSCYWILLENKTKLKKNNKGVWLSGLLTIFAFVTKPNYYRFLFFGFWFSILCSRFLIFLFLNFGRLTKIFKVSTLTSFILLLQKNKMNRFNQMTSHHKTFTIFSRFNSSLK